ncbi:MAG: hypothetical protein ACRENP_24095 [Longimicrobiales bacterium]
MSLDDGRLRDVIAALHASTTNANAVAAGASGTMVIPAMLSILGVTGPSLGDIAGMGASFDEGFGHTVG